jgi:hypothetical protein
MQQLHSEVRRDVNFLRTEVLTGLLAALGTSVTLTAVISRSIEVGQQMTYKRTEIL